MQNEGVLKKNWYGLCENAWFPWQPIADLRMGVCLQKYSYLSVTYPRQLNLLSNKSLDIIYAFYPRVAYAYANYLIIIFINIHENIKNVIVGAPLNRFKPFSKIFF